MPIRKFRNTLMQAFCTSPSSESSSMVNAFLDPTILVRIEINMMSFALSRHKYRQIGNSVPPPLAECIAKEVVRAIRKLQGDN